MVSLATGTSAQQVRVDASVGSKLTYTDNSLYGLAAPKSDFILDFSPRLSISAVGPRLKLGGTAELAALTYANGTRASRLLPLTALTARIEPVDDFLFLEAEVRSSQEIENAFGVRPEGRSTASTHAVRELRLSPYIESVTGAGLHYGIRSDNLRTNESRKGALESQDDGVSASGYFGHHTVHISQDPRPVGWQIEADRNETRYSDSLQPSIVQSTARFGINYALIENINLGVRAGYESNSFFTTNSVRPIYGIELSWRPSTRTNFSAFEERRYFGEGRRISFDHRMRTVALSTLITRGIQTSTEGLFQLPASGNVAALIDNLLVSRFPDPVERARQVRIFMDQQGLPDSTKQSTRLLSQRLSLVTTPAVAWP